MANADKVTLLAGNPLAINLAQWYALVGYLIPNLRFWLFEAHQLRLAQLEQISTPVWDDLLRTSSVLLTRVAELDDATVVLSTEPADTLDSG